MFRQQEYQLNLSIKNTSYNHNTTNTDNGRDNNTTYNNTAA